MGWQQPQAPLSLAEIARRAEVSQRRSEQRRTAAALEARERADDRLWFWPTLALFVLGALVIALLIVAAVTGQGAWA